MSGCQPELPDRDRTLCAGEGGRSGRAPETEDTCSWFKFAICRNVPPTGDRSLPDGSLEAVHRVPTGEELDAAGPHRVGTEEEFHGARYTDNSCEERVCRLTWTELRGVHENELWTGCP